MIPVCLMNYMISPSMDLTEVKIKKFRERVNYVFEVCEKSEEWLIKKDQKSFALLNDVDLDVNVILGSDIADDGGDSTWLIHSSWTTDLSTAAMHESLPKELVSYLCAGIDRFLLSDAEVDRWIVEWSQHLRHVLDAFAASTTADAAMGRVLAMDLLLQKMACFITILRFNTVIERY
ncbi:hypothetical protein C2I38_04770 [Ralstonia solanacearum]|nr:hypothetical protein C2I38_04770 [Ralstonia solanacearum]AYB55410.1 hypothetical protein C2L97_04775 [Ralstonia solanacearum]